MNKSRSEALWLGRTFGNGRLLAIMDSRAVTALRTAAATAVAAKHLARASCRSLLICGCGAQALEQLRALTQVRKMARVFAYDLDPARVGAFAQAAGEATGIRVSPVEDLKGAMRESDIVITCTTAKRYFVTAGMVGPGTFIGAVGADNEEKQEIAPELLARSKLVTDLTEQAARIGDLHHAIVAGRMTVAEVHAELADLVAGRRPGRENDEEVTIFDSTGTGLQDVAAAIAVYRRAMQSGSGMPYQLG